MSLHPVLMEKLNSAVERCHAEAFTRREARLPAVPRKVFSVIGMRRAARAQPVYEWLLASQDEDW